jgi:hypothetical protein
MNQTCKHKKEKETEEALPVFIKDALGRMVINREHPIYKMMREEAKQISDEL